MTQKYILPPAISLLAGGPPLPSSPLLLHLHAQEQLKHQPRQQSRGLDYTWQNMRGISAGELFLNVVSATDNLPWKYYFYLSCKSVMFSQNSILTLELWSLWHCDSADKSFKYKSINFAKLNPGHGFLCSERERWGSQIFHFLKYFLTWGLTVKVCSPDIQQLFPTHLSDPSFDWKWNVNYNQS